MLAACCFAWSAELTVYVHSLVAEKDIDGFVALDVEMMRCESWGAAFAVTKHQCRGMLNLCISDAGETYRSYPCSAESMLLVCADHLC